MTGPLLELRDVHKTFRVRHHPAVSAVAGVTLAIGANECVALVGESGSGKSTVARLALHLTEPDAGEVRFGGRALDRMSVLEFREYRRAVQPIFQDTTETFNPRRRVSDVVRQALRQAGAGPANLDRRTRELLDDVRFPAGPEVMARYPHELSGGQRQRLAIARALAINPRLIIADEPLSGADASIRGQILNLLVDLQRAHHVAYLFITHDIGVAHAFSQRIAVMYRGTIVEEGVTADVLGRPHHPYTRELLASAPTPEGFLDLNRAGSGGSGWITGAGHAEGCRFYGRCPLAGDLCQRLGPDLRTVAPDDHRVACHYAEA